MHARDAVENASPPRRIRMPRITRRQNVIEAGSNSLMWRGVRRRIINRVRTCIRDGRADRYVVRTLLVKNARCEFVPGQRLHFVRQRYRVFAFEILVGLPSFTRNTETSPGADPLHQLDLKEHQARLVPGKSNRYQSVSLGSSTVAFRDTGNGMYSASSPEANTVLPSTIAWPDTDDSVRF